jgi:hypothetical protein
MANGNDWIFDGSIADGWTDKWSNEEKRKFTEDWLNDSFLVDESMEESGISINFVTIQKQFVIYSR